VLDRCLLRAQVNQDRVEEGMQLLEEALDCKWVAVEAAKVLQQACAMLLLAQSAPNLPSTVPA
jgi:hypothetical protein